MSLERPRSSELTTAARRILNGCIEFLARGRARYIPSLRRAFRRRCPSDRRRKGPGVSQKEGLR